MTLKLRFVLLLIGCLVTFLLALLLLRSVEAATMARSLANYRQERAHALESWLELSGQNLRQVANDYSLWDEMVDFVQTQDATWATINLAPTLQNFDLQAIWVLGPGGEWVHQVDAAPAEPLAVPLSPDDLAEVTRGQASPWFFHRSSAGLLEVRIAPIQPSRDINRAEPPAGWLVVARLWHEPLLASLSRLTESHARLTEPGDSSPLSGDNDQVTLPRHLPDWRGQPVATLLLTRRVPEIVHRLQAGADEAKIFVGYGLITIVMLALALHRWVLRPIGAIEASLVDGQLAPLVPLQRQTNEVGRLARLVESSFSQRTTLQREVEERRRVEEALRTSETCLRHAIEERVRLGRDLHDSVIQSVYASGLGLGSVRVLLRTDPAEAERRLEQIRHRLNETIRDLRNFITGLEPEAIRRLSLHDAMAALVDFLRTAAPIKTELKIDEDLTERLSLHARANLLQIVREALSNVLRHGRASFVQVSFQPQDDRGLLTIVDDGHGFDIVAAAGRGRGLNNMRERSLAVAAELVLTTALGKGTRVEVRFPLTGENE